MKRFTQFRHALSARARLAGAATAVLLIASACAQAPTAPPATTSSTAKPDTSAAPAAAPVTRAAAPAAAAPAAAPSWQQGRAADQASSTLHPFAPHFTGRASKDLPLDKLKLPPGFKIEVWAEGIPEARSLALGDKGTVFVSNRNLSEVYAVVDSGGRRDVKKILSGMNSPNGVAFSKGTLFVAERHRITRYDGIENSLDSPPAAKVVIDNLDPSKQPGHFWKYLAMGPDGKLYFNVGAPGNIVLPNYNQATMQRVDPNTGILETVAHGVRNSVGMDWHPRTKELWFTNHARDWISDDLPNDTLHRLSRKGMHFGYPFCHQGDLLDPEFGKGRSCAEFDAPAAKLGPHIAPLGLRFYTGKMFPAQYQNTMFIAMHGSWNRNTKHGYNVMHATTDAKGVTTLKPFLEGFLTDEKGDPPMWGRPVDVLVMRDGALLVSDDFNGIIYRISYKR